MIETVTSNEVVVDCPGDGRIVGRVPNQSHDEVAKLAADLRKAQPAWQALTFRQRAEWLHAWRDWFLDNEKRLGRLIQDETGKSWNDANVELPIVVEVINYYAKHAERFLEPEHPRVHSPAMALKKLTVTYTPYQLVGLITPWNGPIGNPMLDLPQALLAGCAVLTKPSEFTPLTWAEAVRGWNEDIGAPPILGCATGDGATGAAVVDLVDFVHFTGSARTGRKIAAACGERLVPCSLELGGKDPMIVCADADLERAANAAVWGGFMNAGQNCISVERVYVEQPAYDEFLQILTDKTKALRVGMEPDETVEFDIGAMANEAQVQIVERHVEEAKSKGATVVTGGKRKPGSGLFYEPTILTGVTHDMQCMRDETFGPTLPVMKVDSTEQAIALANDSTYGLSASVWTRDKGKGDAIAAQLNVGAVNVNNMYINLFQLPLPQGGWGESGVGHRLGGAHGIRKYTRERVVVSERAAAKTEIHWYPASARKMSIQAKGARLMGAGDWRRKLGLK